MVYGKPLYFFQNHSGFTALPLSFRCMYLQCRQDHQNCCLAYLDFVENNTVVDGGFALPKAGPTREVKPGRPGSWLDFEE